jgi:hypothetical protein
MIELIVPLPRSIGQKKPDLRTVIRRGVFFDLMGRCQVELFRIGSLAEALHRKRDTIVEWEQRAWISKPYFRVHGNDRERIRFYAAEQLVNANVLLVERYEGKRRFSKTADLREFLRALDHEMARGAEVAREGRKTG